MSEGGNISNWDLSQYPGTGSPVSVAPRPLSQDVGDLINGGSLPANDYLARISDATTIAAAAVASNRAAAETLTGTKNFTGATTWVDTVTTLIAPAVGTVLDRAVSIGYLRNAISQSLGAWALINNQTLELATGVLNTALGRYAGQYSSCGHSGLGGYQAGQYAGGLYLQLNGYQAGQYNTANHLIGAGYQSGQYNTGAQSVAIGGTSGRFNSGLYFAGLGYGGGAKNSGDNNTCLGALSWNTSLDAAAAVSFASAAIDPGTQNITVTSTTGIGTIGKRYAMRFTTVTGTAPTGVATNLDYSVLVLSATQLQLIDGIISAIGSGTFTFTPFLGRTFSNCTVVGYGSVPTTSNEVVLGGTNVANITTTASKIKTGVIPAYASDAAADADALLLSGQWYKIGRALFQKP